jgi:NACalpha-BTF3-like transcription factor
MAGDWIKVETSTPDKPEVIGIADLLSIPPQHAFGCLFMVWRWFDQHTTEGNARYVTKMTVDRLSGVTGFAEAMHKVGWLEYDKDGSITLPNFGRHCGDTAKSRALTAKRVAKHKEKGNAKGNADSVSGALPREEKRREEKKEKRDTDFPVEKSADDFELFWKAVSTNWHGSPGAKQQARTEFEKMKPSQEEIDLMIQANVRQFTVAKALEEKGEFAEKFKHVCRWLRYRMWEESEPSATVHPFTKNPNYPGLVARAQKCGHAVEYDTGKELVWITGDGAVA